MIAILEEAGATVEIPNRPTPEYLAGLFAKHGIRPYPMAYLDGSIVLWLFGKRPCGCQIGALFVHVRGGVGQALMSVIGKRLPESHEFMKREIARRTGLPMAYLDGIDRGFTIPYARVDPDDASVYWAGFADGIAAHKLVFGGKVIP